jgi:hypothetical protein
MFLLPRRHLADLLGMGDSAFDPQLFHQFQEPLHRAGRSDPRPESGQAVQNKTPGRSRLDVRGSSLPARLYGYPTSRSSVVEHVDRIL